MESGRRKFLWQSAAVPGSWAVPQSFRRLLAAPVRSVVAGGLLPAPDETTGLPLLMLREGFRYLWTGWTGDLMTEKVTTLVGSRSVILIVLTVLAKKDGGGVF